MPTNSPLNPYRADLGTNDSIGLSKSNIDDIIRASNLPSNNPCMVCQQPASYKIVSKDTKDTTAELQKGIYICHYHAIHNTTIDTNRYALKALE